MMSTPKYSAKWWLPYQRPPIPEHAISQPTTPTAAATTGVPSSFRSRNQQPEQEFPGPRSNATSPYWSPSGRSPAYKASREPALACEADLNYHICEYYLSVISPVVQESLFLGSVEALGFPAGLTKHRINHVLLICALPGHNPCGAPASPTPWDQGWKHLSHDTSARLHISCAPCQPGRSIMAVQTCCIRSCQSDLKRY